VEKSGLEFLKQVQGTKIAPAGLGQIDRDAASERLRQSELDEPVVASLVHRVADDHEWDEQLAKAYIIFCRHSRPNKSDPLWPLIQLNEPSLLWAILGKSPPPPVGSLAYSNAGYGITNPPPTLSQEEIAEGTKRLQIATARLEALGWFRWLMEPVGAVRIG
jgi:hypothetical protein